MIYSVDSKSEQLHQRFTSFRKANKAARLWLGEMAIGDVVKVRGVAVDGSVEHFIPVAAYALTSRGVRKVEA